MADILELAVGAARLIPKELERLIHGDAVTFVEDALGLLDDDPAVERMLQLLSPAFSLGDPCSG